MTCPNCNRPTGRLIIKNGVKACASCRGLSQSGGSKLTGVLTRNSDRVRAQQHTNEGDMITPHVFDKQLNKFVPNQDFIDKYPEKIPDFFTEGDMRKAGYSKSGKVFEARATEQAKVDADNANVEFVVDKGGEHMAETVGALDE
jgi:hypothetical protein